MNARFVLALLVPALVACHRTPADSEALDSRLPSDTGKDPWADRCQAWEVEQEGTDLCWRRCPKGQTYTVSADGSWTCLGEVDMLPQAMAARYCSDLGAGVRFATHAELLAVLGGCDEAAAAGGEGTCLACSGACERESNPTCEQMFGADTQRYWTDLLSEDGFEAIAVSFCSGETALYPTDDQVWISTRCVRDLTR